MAKKAHDDFYLAPGGVNKRRAVMDANSQSYRPLLEVDGTQPYYKYQGIGRITARPPEPVVGTEIVMHVGNAFNVFYGYRQNDYGLLTPDTLGGIVIFQLNTNNSSNPLRMELRTVNGEQIPDVTEVNFMVDELGEVYTFTWNLDFYIKDAFVEDEDFAKYDALRNYIIGKEGNDIIFTFLNL